MDKCETRSCLLKLHKQYNQHRLAFAPFKRSSTRLENTSPSTGVLQGSAYGYTVCTIMTALGMSFASNGRENNMNNDYRKLMRSKMNRMVCGVCGGIGEYLNLDPTVVRLLWLVCSLASCGTGLVVYIVAAVVMPEDVG